MKTKVKIAIIVAIIGAIGAVLAAVISGVISKVINPAGDISIKNSENVILGNITTGEGDVIIGGTKTTNIQALSESQNNGTTQKNEH